MKKLLYIGKIDRSLICKGMFDTLVQNFEFRNFPTITEHVELLNACVEWRPDFVLLHHNRFCFDFEFYEKLKKHVGYIIYWRNDERYPIEDWMYKMAENVDLFLVSSNDSRNELISEALDAECLMMGFEPEKFVEKQRIIPVCFTGQNSFKIFPLSEIRMRFCEQLKKEMGDRFLLAGKNWGGVHQRVEPSIYREAKIGLAINHYDTDGTYSNRMYQIMGNGAMCLAYETKGLLEVFGDNVVYFSSYNEMVKKIDYYLQNDDERKIIAKNGFDYVNTNHTWEAKANKIIELLQKRSLM